MIWFKIKELEKLLVNEEVTDHLAFKYLLAHILLYSLIRHLPGSDEDLWWANYVHLGISLAAIIYGIGKTYEINLEGGNRDYFKRLISLSLVATLQTVVVFFLFSAFIVTVNLGAKTFGFTLIMSSFWEQVLKLVNYLLVIIVYYYILLTSFKRINSADSENKHLETNQDPVL